MTVRDEASRDDAAHEIALPTDASSGDELEEKHAIDSRDRDEEHPRECQTAEVQEEEFGWTQHVDAASNTVYYVHSYTGEVRWPSIAPHGDNAPISASAPDHNTLPSPNPPHLVMLPTGITPSHPPSVHLESWRGGYARYPLYQTTKAILQSANVPDDQVENVMKSACRVLPCTWEASPHGPPFLDPFPVVILDPVWVPSPQTSPPHLSNTADVRWPGPLYGYCPEGPMFGFVAQQPFAHVASSHVSDIPPGFPPERKELFPQLVEKAHNRRGYNLRQARKLMKQLTVQPTKPVKVSESYPTTTRPRDRECTQRKPSTRIDDLYRLSPSPPAIRAS